MPRRLTRKPLVIPAFIILGRRYKFPLTSQITRIFPLIHYHLGVLSFSSSLGIHNWSLIFADPSSTDPLPRNRFIPFPWSPFYYQRIRHLLHIFSFSGYPLGVQKIVDHADLVVKHLNTGPPQLYIPLYHGSKGFPKSDLLLLYPFPCPRPCTTPFNIGM